ncbi:AIPR family protein [Catellatospora chokoriensis]|uniref:Putative abortive infection phage resistance protein n=1 Tax=Catellatospora chokoriensis TaxID=310353 RepID=A0A8J3K3S2_9ACTN|nr:AIPR family protein [Catellatospora chokoriensis]GIF89793.1 putative abortive infection phage resistance protein [Catellatospora chokoriensis]
MSQLHVRHVRDYLDREYRDLVDLSDLDGRPAGEKESAFFSRALGALAVQHLSGCDKSVAVGAIVDGFDDGHVDVVLSQDRPPVLWLAQSKWNERGNAGFGVGDAAKLREALDNITNGEFAGFNSRFRALEASIDQVISNPQVKIVLVVALLGDNVLSAAVQAVFDKIMRDARDLVSIRVVGLQDFHDIVRSAAGVGDASVNLDLRLDSPGYTEEPYKVYQGLVNASQVADWSERYGNRLFDKNIRAALGLTEVNQALLDTLLSRPEDFLYFNNGITILCDNLGRTARHAMNTHGPADLVLEGASVVNGAQTVHCVAEAMRRDPDNAGKARIWVRVISLENCPDRFAEEVTKATNTQNRVEARDFVSLDQNQARIRDEFALSLHKSYVIRRGEREPEPDAGCSVVEAALALASIHRDPAIVARAKQGHERLWRDDTYEKLFGPKVNAYRVWRAVSLLRAVKEEIAAAQDELIGRASQVATHGDFAVVNLVSRQLDLRGIGDADVDWATIVEQARKLAAPTLANVILSVDLHAPNNYVQTIFKSEEKARQILGDHSTTRPTTFNYMATLPDVYRATKPERKSNAVGVLVDANAISDGTSLEFRAQTGRERRELLLWLTEDPRRGRATWVNDRRAPLLWEGDGKQYAPTALVLHMFIEATGSSPKTVQGTSRWTVHGRGTLVDIANLVREDLTE